MGCCTPALGRSQGVYTILTILKLNNHSTLLDLQGCDIVLFPRNAQHCHRHTSHGPHRRTSCHSRYRQRVPSGDQGGPCDWQKKPSTATMTKLITLRCLGLRWVCIFLLFHFFFLSTASITPSSQASILQKCGMAG